MIAAKFDDLHNLGGKREQMKKIRAAEKARLFEIERQRYLKAVADGTDVIEVRSEARSDDDAEALLERFPALNPNFTKSYKAIFGKPRTTFNIQSYNQIGLIDPFAKKLSEPKSKPVLADVADFIYPMSKFDLAESPKVIYIPSVELMFKLMRSCVNIDKVDEIYEILWSEEYDY